MHYKLNVVYGLMQLSKQYTLKRGKMQLLCTIFGIFLTLNLDVSALVKHQGVNKHSPHIENHFSGIIKRNKHVVDLEPPLFAVDRDAPDVSGLICEYRLYPIGNDTEENIPFEVSIVNKKIGAGEMSLKPNFRTRDCALKQEYNFNMAALDCGAGVDVNDRQKNQRKSDRSQVRILVEDVNQHDPFFPKSSYFFDVEGDLEPFQPLVSLNAVDDDCFGRNKEICHYSVVGKEADLFKVTKEGVLFSRRRIRASERDQIFNASVIAHDCGKRKSDPALVVVKVKPACQSMWSGINKRIELISSRQHRVTIATSPELITCVPYDVVTSVEISVALDMSDVASATGCDRDAYALQDVRRMCVDEERNLLELLPSIGEYHNLIGLYSSAETSKNSLPILRREVSRHGGRVFEFNGGDQAFVLSDDDPDLSTALNYLNLTSTFSLSFRMYLSANVSAQHQEKQTILCKSDGYRLSRHHFSVYVHRCHLMLLIRNVHGSDGELKPAEWHWRLSRDESCGGRWLRILFNVNFPNASLFVDGSHITPFLVADDYPLRSAPIGPKWVVGGAWEGRGSKFFQHFNGKLADLVLHVGYLEEVEVLKCVDQCREGLLVTPDGAGNGSVAQTPQAPYGDIRLSFVEAGGDVTRLGQRLSAVAYFNDRQFPAPGSRRLKVSTKIRCVANATKCPVVPDVSSYVMVVPPPDPAIVITGSGHVARPASGLNSSDGVLLFADLSIVTKLDDWEMSYDQEADATVTVLGRTLDSCCIEEHSDGRRGGRFRTHPQHFLAKHRLSMVKTMSGVTIRGVQTIGTYELVLRALTYSNSRAHDYDYLAFTLKCSDLNGRYQSNTYQLVLTILRPQVHLSPVKGDSDRGSLTLAQEGEEPAALVASQFGGPVALREAMVSGRHSMLDADGRSGRNTGAVTPAVIVGVFGILVAFLVVAALVHIRARGGADEHFLDEEAPSDVPEVNEEDLDWDDSAMTITVNPFERAGVDVPGASDEDVSDLEDDKQDATGARTPFSTPVGSRRHDDARQWDE